MNIEKVINLVEQKLSKSDFYNISDKKRVQINSIIIENSTFANFIYIYEQYESIWSNEPKFQKWSIDLNKDVFEKGWNDEQKLAQKIYKLIYHGGDKGYTWKGRLVWTNEI